MRVHVDDVPRMESTSTSSTARSAAASGCLLFHLSRPASASSLLGEFATTIRGIFVRGGAFLAADLARDGATRGASPSILRKCGGHGASPNPGGLIFCRQLQQMFERTRRGIHVCVRIADLREARRHGEHGKIRRIALRHLVPMKRRGHAGVGQRPHRVRGAGRPILGVLVVVQEHAVAFFLPPFRTGQRRNAPLHRTR